MSSSTGNLGLDALADAIAERVIARLKEQSEPEYISAREVARRLGRCLRSIHHMAHEGQIPSVRQGSRVMFRWADVRKAIEG